MSTKPDINLISFNGPHDDGRLVNLGDLDASGGTYADAVKCSTQLQNFTGRFGIVTSGYEDALDVNNRCWNLDLSATLWRLRDCRMGFTLKGGSGLLRLSGPVEGHGRECDVDLGNASDQSHDWVKHVRLNLWSLDGSKIRVRVLGADEPREEPGSGPYEYVFPWKCKPLRKLAVKAFLEWRRFAKRF